MREPYNVLFLCTGNIARSIMAEAILNAEGGGRFRAFSAGSFPKGHVHRLTMERLQAEGISTEGLRSKNWDEFAAPDAPPMDVVITVCDAAASETCPMWPGAPIAAHWGVSDPAEFGPDRQREAFAFAFAALKRRIDQLLALPFGSLDPASLQQRLRNIGRTKDPETAIG